jgi:DNA modification methylase
MESNLPNICTPLQIACTGDARHLPIKTHSVDVIVTSPPYWTKRNYGVANQIGDEATFEDYVGAFQGILTEFWRVLAMHGSLFLNIGDTYSKRNNSMLNLPFQIADVARKTGWIQRNLIVWNKSYSTPSSSRRRLVNRHEFIFHFVKSNQYYYDLQGYKDRFGLDDSTSDVWNLQMTKSKTKHLAPFPQELVERVLHLAAPKAVCTVCGKPATRMTRATDKLNPNRKQAVRAMELAKQHGLSETQIRAIRSVGISDRGKAVQVQTGAGKNREAVIALANEAKEALGGYYREFTFPLWETLGWDFCSCGSEFRCGVVLDPFMGTGTTLRVADAMNLSAIGVDVDTSHFYLDD